MVLHKINLTSCCSTFPPQPRNEIFRESILKHFRDSFSLDNRIIVVEGPPSSGKTVLLSQFARHFSDRAFSFFIGNDYWSSNVTRFLSDMCEQMKGLDTTGKLSKIDTASCSDTDLKMLFTKLYTSIGKMGRQGKGPFYLVIDGISSLASAYGEDSILKFLPTERVEGIYVLLSSINGCKYDFSYSSWPMQYFSPEETEKYLFNHMTPSESRTIYDASDGMPGYIAEIRRQVENGVDKNILLLNPPSGFNSLLETEWQRLNIQDDIILNILALAAFSSESLSFDKISKVLGIDFLKYQSHLQPIYYLNMISDEVNIVELYRPFVSSKLSDRKTLIDQLLINYYETQPDQHSLLYLPTLYKQTDKFEALVNLLNVNSLIQSLGYSKQVPLVKRNLRILSEMAFHKRDWQRLAWAALAESTFCSIISASPVLKNEVEALLSLGDEDKALDLAYSCVLPEDRLGLLVNVCTYLNHKKIDIPEDLLKAIEDTVNLIDNTLEFTPEIINKLVDICADLFPVKTNVAVKLLERIKLVMSNSDNSANLIDFLLSKLYSKLGNHTESFNSIHSLFEDESLREFVSAASSINGIDADLAIQEAAQLSDTSSKIYFLQLWCNSNLKDKNSYKVIQYALKIITENEDYTPTQRHLRQLAGPLLYCDDINTTQALLKEFDILKDTALSNPKDEYTRLELFLASIEKRWSSDSALVRLYDVYYKLDKIEDLDIRCMVLIRILQNLKTIAPLDDQLKLEIREQLSNEFVNCLNNSGSHYSICKRLIHATAKYDINLAISFAERFNLERRRNLSYSDILRVYTAGKLEELDFTIIDNVLQRITHIHYREYVLVQTLRRFSKSSSSLDVNIKLRFLSEAKNIKSSVGRSLALAYYIKWIGLSDIEKCNTLYLQMIESIKSIDTLFVQVKVGFEITTILAGNYQELAQKTYEYTVQRKLQSILSEERLCLLYINTCQIAIHMISDLVRLQDIKDKVDSIIKIIINIPSSEYIALLLSDLSLRCLIAGRKDLFDIAVSKCLGFIDAISDEATLHTIIINTAPMLFEYSNKIFFERIESLNGEDRNIALTRVVEYIMSNRTPEDPVSFKKLRRQIDIADANKICELLNYMDNDALIFNAIFNLINLIIEDIPGSKLRSLFLERQALKIAQNIMKIIDCKLPDKNNIRHDGYKIISMACVSKLRDAAIGTNPYRAPDQWKSICPSWDELLQASLLLDNDTDIALVLSKCGALSRSAGNEFLKHAEQAHGNIKNNYDRADRFYTIADAYKELSNDKAAQYLITEAAKMVQLCSYNEGRDQLLGSIIELAHSIDPSLANNIASKIDNINNRSCIKDNILALNLHEDPSTLEKNKQEDIKRVLAEVCEKIYTSLCSGRSIIYHDDVIAKYIYYGLGQDFDTIKIAISWWIENNILGHKTSNLETLFTGTLCLLEMILKIGEVLIQSSATSVGNSMYQIIATNITTFTVGQENEFYTTIHEWLINNTGVYIKIYDPYFSDKELELLKSLPSDIRVLILLSCKESDLNKTDIKEQFLNRWDYICDQKPPETHFYVFSTPSGQTPLHNRYIITEELGLEFGTSLNGYGKKISTIRYLAYDEKTKIEREIIDPFIVTPPLLHLGERLSMNTFTLCR